MSSTMLQLVTQVTNELGVGTPTAVATNQSQDIVQILALMNACGYELMQQDWRRITKPYTFFTSYLTTTGTYSTSALTITGIPDTSTLSTSYMVVGTGFPNATFITSVDSATQVTVNNYSTNDVTAGAVYFQKVKYDLPSDYESVVDRTQWDKSKHWEMLGPEDAQQWEWLLSGFIATGPRIRWRLFGDYFQIWPGFSNAEFLGFEYRSNGWALSALGVPKTSFTVDTDTCIYPDRLIVLGTKLKYFEAKGFDTTAMFRNYTSQLDTFLAKDKGAANLSFAPRPSSVLISWDNIPDSGYGS